MLRAKDSGQTSHFDDVRLVLPLKNAQFDNGHASLQPLRESDHFLGDVFFERFVWMDATKIDTYTSWWLNQPIWKNISQIRSFPQVGVKIKKYLKPPPRTVFMEKRLQGIFQELVFHGKPLSWCWFALLVRPWFGDMFQQYVENARHGDMVQKGSTCRSCLVSNFGTPH